MFLILGFTKRTSYALSKYLLQKGGCELVVSDISRSEEQRELVQELKQLGLVFDELGNQDPSLLNKYPIEKIFLSPGVPQTIPIIQEALALQIEMLNDIEYFYREFPNRKYIAVTGTDGKTTVTSWLGDVIGQKYPIVLAGNIGYPVFDFADQGFEDYVFILELSSFQLEILAQFKSTISIIINIHEDHMDRYSSIEEYALAKKNIFLNHSQENYAVLNKENEFFEMMTEGIQSNIVCIGSEWKVDKDIIYYNDVPFFDCKNLQMVGVHSMYNALIVCAVAKILRINDEYIFKSLSNFRGVEHRMQFVGEKRGIRFYNDSKATTAKAVECALESFDSKVILLAGGRSKNINFGLLRDIVSEKTKKVLLFGEMALELKEAWTESDCELFSTMEDAFQTAVSYAGEGDIVLLSPGGVSMDQYTSYVARGEHFIKLVHDFQEQ
ncbi:MAG: UDP-N-acetylmuramoyl-L-alanine--D-glutamate ligase [Brevinemataceae bacterium]